MCLPSTDEIAGTTIHEPGHAASPDDAQTAFEAAIAAAKADMLGNPSAAFDHARQAEAITAANPTMRGVREAYATALWLQAEASQRLIDPDTAARLVDTAIAAIGNDGVKSKLDGDLQLTRARVSAAQGRVDRALAAYHRAHDLFAALGEKRGQAMALQGLGQIYDEAHDYDKVLELYARASATYSGEPALDLTAANNTANAYRELGRYGEALDEFGIALGHAQKLESPLLQARILTNIARVHTALGDLNAADAAAEHALTLLKAPGDANWSLFVWGVKAEIELRRSNLSGALTAIEKTFAGIDLDTTSPPYRDMHEIAYRIYKAIGRPDLALAHHVAFKRLDDGGRELTASTNLALISGQFDLASKQLEIEQLTRGQLERDLALQAAKSQKQRLIFIGLIIISLGTMSWIAWGYLSMRSHRNEINSANAKLRKLVSDLNEEIALRRETESALRKAKEEAEGANHAKTQFLANMSHELRTPLNAIIGFAEMIEGEIMGSVGNPAYCGYAADIRQSGRLLLTIVQDILDMAKIDAGRMPVNEEEFDLGEVLRFLVDTERKAALSAGKTIVLETGPGALPVTADEKFVRQIMTHLLTNAVKFTGEDGIVTISLARSERGLDVIVADNGIGIDPAKIDKIMEPFGQIEDSFARSFGGVGLGLPIVRALSELLGGGFRIESALGAGTKAIVTLPAERIGSRKAPNLRLVATP